MLSNETTREMPLLTLDTPQYIKRTKVYTNYIESNALDPNVFDINYTFELPLLIQNVIGIELSNYSFGTYLFPTFAGRFKTLLPNQLYQNGLPIDYVRNNVNGSKTVDIEFGDANGVDTITITVDFEEIDFGEGDRVSLANTLIIDVHGYTALFGFLLFAFLYPVLPIVGAFDPAVYTIGGDTTGLGPISLYIRRTLAPFDYGRVRFLFVTGPSAADSAHKQMGFDKEDTTPDPITNGVLGRYIPNTTPFRYIDINIREFDEFKPVARAYGGFKSHQRPFNPIPHSLRLLSHPLQRLTSMNINISIAGGLPPANFGSRNHNLEFEILSLEPSVNVPSWVTQKIVS